MLFTTFFHSCYALLYDPRRLYFWHSQLWNPPTPFSFKLLALAFCFGLFVWLFWSWNRHLKKKKKKSPSFSAWNTFTGLFQVQTSPFKSDPLCFSHLFTVLIVFVFCTCFLCRLYYGWPVYLDLPPYKILFLCFFLFLLLLLLLWWWWCWWWWLWWWMLFFVVVHFAVWMSN